MQILKVTKVFFSPGETTKKIVNGIAASFSDYPAASIDLTRPDERKASYEFKENDLVIIGAPAYAGRLPAPVVDALSRFKGLNTPVVLVATYGNRAVDDTLMELKKNILDKGFIPVAAGTFIGQHTLLSDLALGRPDEDDMKIVKEMGDALRERLRTAVSYDMKELDIPGTYPYSKPPMGQFPFVVETNEFCFYCMICSNVCPMEAISFSNPYEIDNEKCIRCKSCVHICPAQAKKFTKEPYEALKEKLRGFIDERQEPWYTIG